MTPYTALLERSRADPAAPVLTYRDLATGERMELSAASLANAIAKTAGMLRDELDAEPGAVIGVYLPLHWQRVVWLGACAATGTVFAPESLPDECDVLVVDRPHLDLAGTAREDVVVSLAPFGLPEPGGAPVGVLDAAVAMRGHPDTFVPYEMATPDMPLLRDGDRVIAHGEVMEQAASALAERGVGPGQRFAVVDPDPLADILGLAGPLAVGSAVVLVAHPGSGDLPGTLAEEGLVTAAG
jgi:uncharacterized protein (TIGR03089 family)